MPDYCGWIPTVGGRLSFALIGEPQANTNSDYVNVANRRHRYVVCHQRRFLLDTAFPFLKRFLSKHLFDLEGEFDFLLFGKCSNDPVDRNGDLNGVACFFGPENRWPKVWPLVKSVIDDLQKVHEEDLDNLNEVFDSREQALQQAIKGDAIFWCNFKLSREGIAEFTVPRTTEFVVDTRINPMTYHERHKHFATAQIYFFLKDVTHIHQHHHAKTDTIVDLHAWDKNLTWRQQTLRALYRKVLRYKRNPSVESCISALGVLAYLRSFRELLGRVDPSAGGLVSELEHLALSDENIEKSISIALNKAENKKSHSEKFSDRLRTITLGVVGLVLSLVGLSRFVEPPLKIDQSETWLPDVTRFIVMHPMPFSGIVFVVIFLYLTFRDHIAWRDWQWVQDIVRIALALPKNKAAFWLFFMAVSLLVLSIINLFVW